jgi:hypothetical protein
MDNVMLSFQFPNHLPFLASRDAKDDITATVKVPWGDRPMRPLRMYALTTPRVIKALSLRVQFRSIPGVLTRGFIIRFSFHNDAPYQLSDSTWNCSAENYATWSHHVSSNLVKECSDGRDEEGPCPYSSAGCGPGMVASNNKCFFAVTQFDVPPF